MTAVAPPPLSFQQHNNRIAAWNSGNHNHMSAGGESEDASKMFAQGPRKTIQRQNSASSIASTASSTSTISASSTQTSNTSVSSSNGDSSWAAKKKPTRNLWPPGKAEPATGISTARPQPVNSNGSAPTATSAMTSLNAPMAPIQGNGTAQSNAAARPQQNEQAPAAILHLTPINGTFERKQISVPYYPEVLRIGRQTNQKTIPTPGNGYFDSKVLSRQHAEVWADRQGRVFIRDVKSSNGTFVNGMRLSQENKESEPRELREQDVLELGIDIVSEDQKTVVHHKVAAKVEHAGIYGQGNDVLSFGDLDPSAGGGLMAAPQIKRNVSQNSVNGRIPGMAPGQAAANAGMMQQPSQMRNWLNPITTEHIVKKLNAEMKLAKQQSEDLARARQCLDALLSGHPKALDTKDIRAPEKTKSSPTKAKLDLKAHFMDPPAPPPQAPLPDKPDVAKALADPAIQPLLRRSDTARPMSNENSPVRYTDHSSDILRLCEELKLAKGEISTQSERMKDLESQLAQERTARESAEERASRLESADKTDAPKRSFFSSLSSGSSDLQAQMARLQATMDEMKQQMEQYRNRAETAESERDEARQTLAELVESKRAAAAASETPARNSSKSRRNAKKSRDVTEVALHETNGHAIAPSPPSSPTAVTLLERAGLQEGQPITPEQAKLLTQLLSQEVLGAAALERHSGESAILYHGRPLSAAAIVVIFGVALMGWMNSWPRVER